MTLTDQWMLVLPLGLVAVVFAAIPRIRYEIDDKFVRVVWFGVTVRKIALTDVAEVSARSCWWNEHWCNTFWPFGREVLIRRKSGLIRNFVITPANRDEFIRELQAKLAVTNHA